MIAKGQRLVAEQIKQIADERDIPIIENPPVAGYCLNWLKLVITYQENHLKSLLKSWHLCPFKNKKTKATNTFDR